MANDNHASYAKVGLTLVLGTVAILGALVYFGGVGDRRGEMLCETYYDYPVSGLNVGSEVNFRGVKIGEVKDISFVSAEYDDYAEDDAQVIVIRMALDRRRCRLSDDEKAEEVLDDLVKRGLRATVSSSGITGLSKLELNLPRTGTSVKASRAISWKPSQFLIPSEPSILESFSDSATVVMNKIRNMNFAATWSNVTSIAESAASVVRNVDALVDGQRAAVGEILSRLEESTRDFRELGDRLKENPSLLLRSADPEPLPETVR